MNDQNISGLVKASMLKGAPYKILPIETVCVRANMFLQSSPAAVDVLLHMHNDDI